MSTIDLGELGQMKKKSPSPSALQIKIKNQWLLPSIEDIDAMLGRKGD